MDDIIKHKTTVFNTCNELEERIAKLHHGLTYTQIVETGLLIAEITRDNTPMYIGNINPKWLLWDDVIVQLKTRIDIDLQDEIEKIDNEIDILTKKRINLTKQSKETATTFQEKLKIWNDDPNLEDEDFCSVNGIISNWIKENDFHRYETIYLNEYFQDDISWLLMTQEEIEEESKTNENVIKWVEEAKKSIPILTQFINNNIGTIKIDW